MRVKMPVSIKEGEYFSRPSWSTGIGTKQQYISSKKGDEEDPFSPPPPSLPKRTPKNRSFRWSGQQVCAGKPLEETIEPKKIKFDLIN
jgi:hypothetical protein